MKRLKNIIPMSLTFKCKKRNLFFNIIFQLFFFLPASLLGQNHFQETIQINWKSETFNGSDLPEFANSFNDQGTAYFIKQIPLPNNYSSVKVEPTFTFTQSLKDSLLKTLPSSFTLNHWVGYQNKRPYLFVKIRPYKREKNQLELIQTLAIKGNKSSQTATLNKKHEEEWPENSPLASGNWYKIAIEKSGIFKLTYNDLKNLGVNPSDINPQHLHLYGNGGHMLPQANSAEIHKGLKENAIYIEGEEDGSFDQNDYILFYGEGPHSWTYNPNDSTYKHHKHDYSNKAYYFITINNKKGKRIQSQNSLSQANYETNHFDELLFHEKEQLTEINESIKTGRNWYGEVFDNEQVHSFDFNLNGAADSVRIEYRLAHRSQIKTNFDIYVNNNREAKVNIPSVDINDYEADYIKLRKGNLAVYNQPTNTEVRIYYNKVADGKGWLDYLALTARSPLSYNNSQITIRDQFSIHYDKTKYVLSNVPSSLQVWDVTEPVNAHRQNMQNNHFFIDSSNVLRKYIAFTPSDAYSPQPIGYVPNQNLHALDTAEMLIISHDNFLAQAKELADFHRNEDGLKVHVVTPHQIYQEFSSGSQDITAIRNFVRMFYDRAKSKAGQPKYLLLFGDASYDYKNRIENNTNFVPTYQSPNAYSPTQAFATDDYYGYLDSNEGAMDRLIGNAPHYLDISIGRIPVSNTEQARAVIKKIKNYHNNKSSFGEWQNVITFAADDADESWDMDHIKYSEQLANLVNTQKPVYNIDKIYLDAYKQVTTPGGTRYPEVTKAINQRINEGTLVFNYIGHGGELGLTKERVLRKEDIASWNNGYKLPLFITATCEFSRYDDPERISAGEQCLLKENGGAIGLLSTTRLVYSSQNFSLNRNVFNNNIFERINGRYKTLGEIIKTAKTRFDQNNPFNRNTRKFALIGDPALKLAYPRKNIETTHINQKSFSSNDTLKALQKVTLKGEIQDHNGKIIKDFNGIIYPQIFDKKVTLSTLANDPPAKKYQFKLRNSTIYDGKARVKNGRFEVTFVVPKDISYTVGDGKISYYATNNEIDAHGYSYVKVGGTADSPIQDDQPPEVKLYINDRQFESGGITGKNPMLIADVSDDNGINTAVNGIGHQPQLILDNNIPEKLPDAYEASLDSYKKGTIKHQMLNLSEGRHYLKLKVWDVANNSGEGSIEFIVAGSNEMVVENLMNYPNPFSQNTTFEFEHNQDGASLNVTLNIYDTKGNLHRKIKRQITTEGNVTELNWKGTNQYGQPLSSGVYIYELIIRNNQGKVTQATNKLVIQK